MDGIVHSIPVDAQPLPFGKVRARCGAIVKDGPYRDATCERCRALDRRDADRLAIVLGDEVDQ